MTLFKVGTRLRSAVCTTEIIVVAAPERDLEISCGGVPMLGIEAELSTVKPATLDGEPTLVGKRYTNAEGDLEVLCSKAGDGSLAVAGQALTMKEAKPLPSSD